VTSPPTGRLRLEQRARGDVTAENVTATQGRGSNGVQGVDNFDGNPRPGLVFEIKVGKGKPFVCAKDLLGLQDKPEARPLLHSMLGHLDSKDFNPKAGPDTMATSVSSKKG
jgi:hypothetical protein